MNRKHAADKERIRAMAAHCEVAPWMAEVQCQQLNKIASIEARLAQLKFELIWRDGRKPK
jgi:hypothetical protein